MENRYSFGLYNIKYLKEKKNMDIRELFADAGGIYLRLFLDVRSGANVSIYTLTILFIIYLVIFFHGLLLRDQEPGVITVFPTVSVTSPHDISDCLVYFPLSIILN